jgi:hypothetical protein
MCGHQGWKALRFSTLQCNIFLYIFTLSACCLCSFKRIQMFELITPWLPYLALGCIAGLLAGLLGVGGGLIIVPVLALLFQHLGIGGDKLMQLALGTSLATIIATSLSSIAAHQRHGNVLWPILKALTPGIIIGVLCGSWLADQINSDTLRFGFAIFVLIVASQMLLGLQPSSQRQPPGRIGLGGAGSIIGLVSSLVGIGGGTLTTPFLLWHNITLRQAIGTSAACGLPIAVFGSLGYLLVGLDANQLPANSSGYIYWPAFFGIITTSIMFAPLGAWLTGILPVAVLKKVFALVLVAVAVRLLVS